jgi:hypothetical protein
VRRGPLTPIASIDIVRQGERRAVSDETIRNSLLIEPGDLFIRSDVARSQRALYESGLFRSAVIDTAVATDAATGRTVCAQQGSQAATDSAQERRAGARTTAAAGDSSKALVVCVVEGPPREVRTSAGFSTADFFQLDARYTDNYWLGGARRLDVTGAIGNLGAQQLFNTFPFSLGNGYNAGTDAENALRRAGRFFSPTFQAGVDVRQRWFGSPRNTVGGGLFIHRRISPGVFVDRGQGANLAFTRALTQEIPASATYRFEVSRVDAGDVYFCVNYGVCDAPTINALRGQQRLSPFASWRGSRRSTPRAPRSRTSATTASRPRRRRIGASRSAAASSPAACAAAGWTRCPGRTRRWAWDGRRSTARGRCCTRASASTPVARRACAASARTSSARAC